MRTTSVGPNDLHGSFSLDVEGNQAATPAPGKPQVRLLKYHGYRRAFLGNCFSVKDIEDPEAEALYKELLRQGEACSTRIRERDKVTFIFRMEGVEGTLAIYAVLGFKGFIKVGLAEDASVAPDGEIFL